MNVENLEAWFQKHRSDTNYQHREMALAEFDVKALDSFMKLKVAHRQRVLDVCRAYKVVIDDQPETMDRMLRYRYMAQTNLFALCHLLEKYKDTTDKTYIWTDGTTHNTHEEICNEFFVRKDPTIKTFKQFATGYVDHKERLLLVPRGGFKSSIDMADTVQWIINYPEVTIMILTGVLKLAQDFVGEIKGFFKLEDGTMENVNLFETKKAIKPKTLDDDTPFMFQVLFAEHCIDKDEGTLQAYQTPAVSQTEKECTVWAASIDQNLSGWHVGVMKLDDVVTNENSRTVDRIINVNKQVSINQAMLHPYGFYDKIGTWYDSEDTYGQDMKHIKACEKSGDPITMKVYLRACWWPNAAAIKAGKVESEMLESDYELWFNVPGQLTYAFLRSKMHDAEGFAVKYLNDPTKAHTVKFPRELLERRTIHSNLLPQSGLVVTCIDTAYSTKSWADYTVMITALIYGGRFYIIDMARGKWNEFELPCKIAAVANQWRPTRICIEESVGVKWLGKEIYREMDKLRVRVPIEFVPMGKGSKATAKDAMAKPVLRYLGDERLLFANQMVGLEEMYAELSAFGTAASQHDDIVDALALLVDQFSSYADMEGKKSEASPDFVISSDHKKQYDHIYGKGSYDKCFKQHALNTALDHPDMATADAVKASQESAGSYFDPLESAGLY
jgi:predicted phage terminase large subunit-like protein